VGVEDWRGGLGVLRRLVESGEQKKVGAHVCEWCGLVVRMYGVRETMGEGWALCIERWRYYRKGAAAARHVCGGGAGCLRERWRGREWSGLRERESEKESERGKMGGEEAVVERKGDDGGSKLREDGGSGQADVAEVLQTSTSPVRRSKRLMERAMEDEEGTRKRAKLCF
jgi:hypothetical protein